MDYAFAPGGRTYGRYMRKLYTDHPDIELISSSDAGGSDVSDFIIYLIIRQSNTPADFPPDELHIASHATSSGTMEISLDSDQSQIHATFEDAVSADDNDTISVPTDVVMGGGIFVTSSVNIRGCNVGKAIPFLEKLKEGFSNIPFLTAPYHFHYLSWAHRSRGLFEYMMYDFKLMSKDRITSRADMIAAFEATENALIDDTFVPINSWSDWVPSRYRRSGKQEFDRRVPLGETVAGRYTRLNAGREYRYKRKRDVINIPNIASAPNASQHESLLRTHLRGLIAMEDDHVFPYFKRLGFETFDDMVNGHNWTYTYSSRTDELICTGTRYEVHILIPVTDPDTGNLIFNFHPKAGTSHTAVNNMTTSDVRLFATV